MMDMATTFVVLGSSITVMALSVLLLAWLPAWKAKRFARAEAKRKAHQAHKCSMGGHEWIAQHEHHSMVSPLCSMINLPVVCAGCGVKAHATWVPGEGMSGVVVDRS